MTPDDLPAAAKPAALTDALRKTGVLATNRVVQVTTESDTPIILSRIVRLRLTYDGPTSEAPETIILKTRPTLTPDKAHPSDNTWNSGRQEVEFYTTIAPNLPAGVVPRCFGAHHASETGAWHLLLEDLTDTHVLATEWPLPPSQAQCRTILTARARLHAAWWDDPRLGVSAGTWLDAEAIEHYRQRQQRNYAAFADRLGDNLPPERRDLYERFLDAIPRLYARYRTHHNVTIVQGDAHVWNCFLPRNGGNDVRLFDWQFWRIFVPAMDLAYMMAMHWYPDRRQRLECLLLDHYHETLLALGIAGYDRQALADDYRWSVLMQIGLPLSLSAAGMPPVIWWNNLERILLAVDDLDCRELLT
jgi:hypothetical protein